MDKIKNSQNNEKKQVKRPYQKNNIKRPNMNKSRGANSASKLKIIPLGGLDEIGKNITVFEYENDIIAVDCGLAFPDDEMFGIDLVIPDFSYLVKNKEKLRGVFLTHGHEDHIGSLPYFLKELNVPVYGTRLTLGIVSTKLDEHKLKNKCKLNEVKHGQTISTGQFKVEFIRVNHSIPDAAALAISCPAGIVVHTGDFKIDSTPIDGEMMDLARLGELGNKGVLALMSDSTNSEKPGFAMSEKKVGESLCSYFKNADKRIIVATFASNVHRVQQIINAAVMFGRKVALSGRSMVNIVKVASELGVVSIPEGVLIDIETINRYPKNKIVVVSTGSQGEPMSALYRMAFSDHKKISVGSDDLIIISASPIPGNEKTVSKVVNELLKLGADVVYESLADIHVSGHACQEEQKLVLALTKPKYFIPVHGEYKHLKKHASLAAAMGYENNKILVPDTGKIIEINHGGAKVTGTVPSGNVLVDGLGVGDVGSVVLRDRKLLSEDGLIIVVATIDKYSKQVVAGPDIVSRGFIYVKESEALIEDAKRVVRITLMQCEQRNINDWGSMKNEVKDALNAYLYEKTKRRPMILPILMEVER